MRCRAIHVIIAAIGLIAADIAVAAPADFGTAWRSVVDQYASDLVTDSIVGSSLAIAQDGRTLRSFHHGVSNQATARPVDDDTLYNWGSITKLFTVVAVMQLRDRGKLSLDDRLVDHIPEAKQIHNRFGPMSAVTLRHLIGHSSGLRQPVFPWRGDEDWQPMAPPHWEQVAATMPYTQIEFEPGTRYGYSELGLSLLGRIVEQISGDDIATYVTKNILMPLGMSRSYFGSTPYYLQRHRSSSYTRSGTALRDLGTEVQAGATHGNIGLNGPVSDLLRFGNFLVGAGDNGSYDGILARTTLAEMWQPQFVTQERPTHTERMGHSFFLYEQPTDDGRLRMIGSIGGHQGFLAMLYVHPESRSVIAQAMNTLSDRPWRETAFIRARQNLIGKAVAALNGRKRR